jgi:magnesium transporter
MKKQKNVGLAPGTVLYTGQKTDLPIRINYIEYTPEKYNEELNQSIERVVLHPSNLKLVQWYDIRGLHDEKLIENIAKVFSMHPIAIEDAVDVTQRPVFTEYDDAAFISLKCVYFDDANFRMNAQNIAIYFGEGFVLSFQENEDDLFEKIRTRIKSQTTRVRHKKSDYLAYSIVDLLVDRYFVIMEKIGHAVERLEEDISLRPEEVDKERIFILRKELLKIRRTLSPLRDALSHFQRSNLDIIDEKTISFIRDASDHTIQIMDNIDNLRDILSSLQDLYISEISLKMNQVVQFLTIITAIFVPISFLAGLYGMNFKYIPELEYKYSYFILLAVMFIIIFALIWHFKRKKWL